MVETSCGHFSGQLSSCVEFSGFHRVKCKLYEIDGLQWARALGKFQQSVEGSGLMDGQSHGGKVAELCRFNMQFLCLPVDNV